MSDPFAPFGDIDPLLRGDNGTRRDDRVDEIWAYVTVDEEDNCEGIIAAPLAGTTMPLIGADGNRMRSYRSIAEFLARGLGKRIELVKFTTREHIEWIEP